MRRYVSLTTVLVGLSLALAGCGSSGHHHSGDVFTGLGTTTPAAASAGSSATTPSSSSTTTSASTPSIPGLKPVATAVQTEPNTRVSETYALGPIGYAAADAGNATEAAQSCSNDLASSLQSDVFAEGEVTFRYSKGTLPLNLTLSIQKVFEGTDVLTGTNPDGPAGNMILEESDGSWNCGDDEGTDFDLSLQPGTTITEPFWLILTGALSNANPMLSQHQLDNLAFNPIALVGDAIGGSFHGSGPRVYSCPFGTVVLPFASGTSVSTSSGVCKSGS